MPTVQTLRTQPALIDHTSSPIHLFHISIERKKPLYYCYYSNPSKPESHKLIYNPSYRNRFLKHMLHYLSYRSPEKPRRNECIRTTIASRQGDGYSTLLHSETQPFCLDIFSTCVFHSIPPGTRNSLQASAWIS